MTTKPPVEAAAPSTTDAAAGSAAPGRVLDGAAPGPEAGGAGAGLGSTGAAPEPEAGGAGGAPGVGAGAPVAAGGGAPAAAVDSGWQTHPGTVSPTSTIAVMRMPRSSHAFAHDDGPWPFASRSFDLMYPGIQPVADTMTKLKPNAHACFMTPSLPRAGRRR